MLKVENLIKESLNKKINEEFFNQPGCCDMKVLSLVIHFYGNMVASGPEYS